MKSNPDDRRSVTFGFRDGCFVTSILMHVALLRALGFKAERLERDGTTSNFWFKVSGVGTGELSLEHAVSGIHDPQRLDAPEADRVRFFKLAQEHYQTVLREVKNAAD